MPPLEDLVGRTAAGCEEWKGRGTARGAPKVEREAAAGLMSMDTSATLRSG